jgi:carboxymethylenebutenolidase
MDKNKTVIGIVVLAIILFVLFLILRDPVSVPGGNEDRAGEENTTTSSNTNSQLMSGIGEPAVPLTTGEITYFSSGIDYKGYYAKPRDASSSKTYPGVIMIHEWWGLNDGIRDAAEMLAGQGYQVIAVDLFGSVASTSDAARVQVSSLDQAKALANLKAAADFLRGNGATKIASLGWCFGGGQSLQLSLSGEELDATVIYYGNLVTDRNQLQKIKWPVLGVFGDKDTSIPVSTVTDFKDSLTFLGTTNEIYVYPGVGHAFANPSGANYAPRETADAWGKTLAFLNKNLK